MSSVSPQRRIAKEERRRLRAESMRSRVRRALRQAREFVDSGDMDSAKAAVLQACRALDKAVSQGIIHPNSAARRKSRLVKRLNQVLPAPS